MIEGLVLGGGMLGLVGFAIKTYVDMNRKASGMYKRLDVYRDEMYGRFTTKEVCEIMHRQLKEDILEIKADVKSLLHKNGIQNGRTRERNGER